MSRRVPAPAPGSSRRCKNCRSPSSRSWAPSSVACGGCQLLRGGLATLAVGGGCHIAMMAIGATFTILSPGVHLTQSLRRSASSRCSSLPTGASTSRCASAVGDADRAVIEIRHPNCKSGLARRSACSAATIRIPSRLGAVAVDRWSALRSPTQGGRSPSASLPRTAASKK